MTATAEPASPARTRELLASGVTLRWWQTTAFLEVAGPDAATLLDGLCTQAVERIEPGTGVLGLFLDAKAHLIAPAVLHRTADAAWQDPRRGDEIAAAPRLLLETLPELVEPLAAHLRRYRLRAKATIEAVELATVALVGDGASAEPGAAPDGGAWSVVAGQAFPTVALLGTADACTALVQGAGADAAFELADPDALESARIEAGVAGLHDLLVGRMPAEVGGMASAVALDAGCYLGQEPVARLHYRGRANRTLRRIDSTDPIAPAPAAEATGDQPLDPADALALHRAGDDDSARSIGRLTTWATAPDGRTVALAMLRRELAEGDAVRLVGSTSQLLVVDSVEPADDDA